MSISQLPGDSLIWSFTICYVRLYPLPFRTFGIRRLAIAGRCLPKMDSSGNVMHLTVGLASVAPEIRPCPTSALSLGGGYVRVSPNFLCELLYHLVAEGAVQCDSLVPRRFGIRILSVV